ncbi:MAG: M23 family metallopeptidase [Clostridia bacterium]|nr:M23 family metallopeptidase [Clostridia bacterium]
MQSENGGLKIHTKIIPEMNTEVEKKRVFPNIHLKMPEIALPAFEFKRARNKMRSSAISRKGRSRPVNRSAGRSRVARRRTPAQRLLRNTTIACTLVMCVMALASIDAPWSRQAVQAVSNAVTMTMNLDDTLGRLNFVRDWMPDAAQVFWNMGAENAMARPVSGALTHAYDDGQPWLEYQTASEQPVYAAIDGTVAAIMENSNGEWTLMLDHDDGEQTIYAYLGKAIVSTGQSVVKGAQIGITANSEQSRLYFEMRKNSEPVDPTSRMGGA